MDNKPSFTFTTPLTVNVVEIKGEEHMFVEGDISTNDIDLVNDIMTKECQESMQKQIMEKNLKLDIEHEAFRGENHEEKEINKTKIPAGKLIDATVKNLGEERYSTRVKGEINRHNPRYKEIKGNLTEGYLDAFSVAFLPTDISFKEIEGKTIRMLNDVLLLNVALTGNPCNTKAQLVEIFTKSMDAIEEYKKMKKDNPDIEKNLVVKSNSTEKSEEITKLKKKKKKMTDEDQNQDASQGDESNEAEQKDTLKSVNEQLKSLSEKFEAVSKDNVSLKESVSEITKSLTKITEVLNKPIHKSQGVQMNDAESKAKSEGKSVDPLSLF
jgi:hypothetical protein